VFWQANVHRHNCSDIKYVFLDHIDPSYIFDEIKESSFLKEPICLKLDNQIQEKQYINGTLDPSVIMIQGYLHLMINNQVIFIQ